jgi:hypothetical protein
VAICRNFGLGLFGDSKLGDNWWLVRKDRKTSPLNKASGAEIPYIEAKDFKKQYVRTIHTALDRFSLLLRYI